MKESYFEDLANHDVPDHALATREGAAERWFGVRAGRAIQPRNGLVRVPTRSWYAEGNIAGGVLASRQPTVGDPEHAHDLFMLRTGRYHDHSLVVMVGRVVREGRGRNPVMDDREKSDGLVDLGSCRKTLRAERRRWWREAERSGEHASRTRLGLIRRARSVRWIVCAEWQQRTRRRGSPRS